MGCNGAGESGSLVPVSKIAFWFGVMLLFPFAPALKPVGMPSPLLLSDLGCLFPQKPIVLRHF